MGLENKGFPVIDMTLNELAKDHIRYMVGGHAPKTLGEIVYSIQFPERPGALLNFLTSLGSRWNISMFHYRNHGAAFGKVLMGIQLPESERNDFEQRLDAVGFEYKNESQNTAYTTFVGDYK
jgi:threonine dehydratase